MRVTLEDLLQYETILIALVAVGYALFLGYHYLAAGDDNAKAHGRMFLAEANANLVTISFAILAGVGLLAETPVWIQNLMRNWIAIPCIVSSYLLHQHLKKVRNPPDVRSRNE